MSEVMPEVDTATSGAEATGTEGGYDPDDWYGSELDADVAAVTEPWPEGVPEMPDDFQPDMSYAQRREAWIAENGSEDGSEPFIPPVDIFDSAAAPHGPMSGGSGMGAAGRMPFTGNVNAGRNGWSLFKIGLTVNVNRSRNKTNNFGSGNTLAGAVLGGFGGGRGRRRSRSMDWNGIGVRTTRRRRGGW